jgi:hypothetical protein
MLTLLVIGLLALTVITVAFIAASIIDADSFEFTTAIWKLATFSIRIRSSSSCRGKNTDKSSDCELPP